MKVPFYDEWWEVPFTEEVRTLLSSEMETEDITVLQAILAELPEGIDKILVQLSLLNLYIRDKQKGRAE